MRGKHYKAYREDTNVVLLDPEVARVFRDSASVNRALRMLIDLAESTRRQRDGKRPSDPAQDARVSDGHVAIGRETRIRAGFGTLHDGSTGPSCRIVS